MKNAVSHSDSVTLRSSFEKLCLSCVVFALAVSNAHDLFGQALDSIQGRWKIVAHTNFGMSSSRLGRTECIISGQKLEIIDRMGTKLDLVALYHIGVKKGSPTQINLIPRPRPPRQGRPLSAAEQKHAEGGFPGICQWKDGFLEIYYPPDSTDARLKKMPPDGGDQGKFIRMKRIGSVEGHGGKVEKKGKTSSDSSQAKDASKADATSSSGSPAMSEVNSMKKKFDELVHSIALKDMTIKSLEAEVKRLRKENERLENELTKARKEEPVL